MGLDAKMKNSDTVWNNIKRNYSQLHAAESKVADFVLKNPQRAVMANVSELAEHTGVSTATIIRFCKHIGYEGLYEMKLHLSHDIGTDAAGENYVNGGSEENTILSRFQMVANNAMEVAKNIDEEMIKKCAAAIDGCSMAYSIGNGYNKIIAEEFRYRLARMGIRCSGGGYSETDFENLYLGEENDVAVFFSRTGEDKKTYKEMELAKKRKMITISITNAVKCPMAEQATYALATGIDQYSRACNWEYNTSLNMKILLEILMTYVTKRLEDKEYLKGIVVEERM